MSSTGEVDKELYHYLHFSFLTSSRRNVTPDESALRDIQLKLDESLVRGAPSDFKVLVDSAISSLGPENDDDDLPIEYRESQRGKPCGHVFEQGEGVYHCRDCALDPTCVFCYRCFHASNHENHETEFSISSGNGGCCDCGDAEAWRIQPECEYHSMTESMDVTLDGYADGKASYAPLPDPLKCSIRKTIATVLDFIVDTLNASPAPSNSNLDIETIRKKNPPDLVPRPPTLQNLSSDEPHYACILWNDEQHSFDEVIDKVMHSTRKSREGAGRVADSVDCIGRDVISAGPSLSRILFIAKEVSSAAGTTHGGLTVSVRLGPDVFRESVAGMALEWLRSLLRRSVGSQSSCEQLYESVTDFLRLTICEEICAPRRPIREILSGRSYDEIHFSRYDFIPLRLDFFLALESKLWKCVRVTLKELYINTLVVAGEDFKKTLARRFAQSYLMVAHSYLMKDREWDLSIINLSVQLFTVPTIAAHLVESTNITTVLFTILKTLFISEAFPVQCNLEKFFISFQTCLSSRLAHYPKLNCELHAVYRSSQYHHVFNDVQYLIGTPQVASSIFRKSDLDGLDAFLDLCTVLQGMNPQRRESTTHVAYESQGWIGAFPLSVNVCGMIDRVYDTFAPTTIENVEIDFTILQRAIRKVVKALDIWCAHEQRMEGRACLQTVPNASSNQETVNTWKQITFIPHLPTKAIHFEVSRLDVSFHYPLHWLLSSLLSLVPNYLIALNGRDTDRKPFTLKELFEEETPFDSTSHQLRSDNSFKLHFPENALDSEGSLPVDLEKPADVDPQFTHLSVTDRVSRMMDYPLRVEVLLAQIHAGLWVRNGHSMRDQAYTYMNHLLRDLSDNYLYLLQTSCVILGPDAFFATMLDKFGLIEWFSGSSSTFAHIKRIDQRKLNIVVEDFLLSLVFILTERARCTAMSIESQIRRELIHALAVHPNGMQFSKIGEIIPDRLTRDRPLSPDIVYQNGVPVEFQAKSRSMEVILKELTTFKFPDNASDSGLYELREELLVEVDPWFYHYSPAQRIEIENVLSRHADKCLKDVSKDLILTSFVCEIENDAVRKAIQYRVRPVRVNLIESNCCLYPLNSATISRSFLKAMFFGLYNLTKVDNPVVSDKIMASLVHLLIHSVESDAYLQGSTSPEELFSFSASRVVFDVTEERGNFSASLLDLLLDVLNRYDSEHFKDYVDRLTYIVSQMVKFGGDVPAAKVQSWREGHRLRSKKEGDSEEASDKAKRKAAAKRRQAAMMAQLEKQQNAFMESFAEDEDFINENVSKRVELGNETIESAIEAIPNERVKDFEAGNCIVCQGEMEVGSKEYGYLSMMQTCQIERSRFLNFEDPDIVKTLLRKVPSLDEEGRKGPQEFGARVSPPTLRKDLKAASSLIPPLPLPARSPDLFLSTCGHLMHLSCFDGYKASVIARVVNDDRTYPENVERHEFLCPLCKTLGNCIVPVLMKSVKERVNWNGSLQKVDGAFMERKPVASGGADFEHWWASCRATIEKAWLASSQVEKEKEPENLSDDMDISTDAPQIEPGTSSANSGMIRRLMTLFSRRGSQSSQPPHVPVSASADRRSDGSFRLVSGIFPYVFPTLEAITKETMQGSFYDRLLFSVATTIAGIERAARGVAAKSSNFRLDLGRSGFKRINVLENVGPSAVSILRLIAYALLQLRPFEKSVSVGTNLKRNSQSVLAILLRKLGPEDESLLTKDPFENFVENTLVYDFDSDLSNEDGLKLLTVFWIVEVVRFFIASAESFWAGDCWASLDVETDNFDVDPNDLEALRSFMSILLAEVLPKDPIVSNFFLTKKINFSYLWVLSKSAMLPFLRKCSIYLAVKFNMVPPSGDNGFGYENPAEDAFKKNSTNEFDHLRAYLNLPDVIDIAKMMISSDGNTFARLILSKCLIGLESKCLRPENAGEDIVKLRSTSLQTD
ncbi:hypothetical protein HDU67_007724 [Dinochytrium kinnereticum]|nr:hypothetical protein HDU67_007724 [Dinochytrium kinnereticum]